MTPRVTLPVPPPVSPMLAKLARELPDRRRAGSTSRSGTASAASCSATATRSSSAAATSGRSPATSPSSSSRCATRCPSRRCVDGEIVIATEHGLDFDLLSLRIHPAASRVDELAERDARRRSSRSTCSPRATTTSASSRSPSGARGSRRVLADAEPPDPPHAGDHATATSPSDWFEHVRGRGARRRGRQAARRARTARASARWLKVKHLRTADCVVAGFRMHKDGNGRRLAAPRSLRRRGRRCTTSAWRAASPRRCGPSSSRSSSRTGRTRSTTTRGGSGPTPQAQRGGRAAMPGGRAAGTRRKDLSLGAAADRARRRGRVRAPAGRPVPPHRPVPALAAGPRPGSCTYEQLEVPVPVELHEVFGA